MFLLTCRGMSLAWELVSQDEPIKIGWRKLQRRVYRMPDGSEQEFYLKYEGPFASVIARTPEGKFILAKQYRPGPGRIVHDLPGGVVESGESPEQAIRRELLEETGYEADTFEPVGVFIVAPTSTAMVHGFLAVNCRKVAEPKTDHGEFVECVEVSLEQFRDFALHGEMCDSDAALVALKKLDLLV